MATQINFFYAQYATQFMAIDEDNDGLFCTIPSESNGESYTVRCSEHSDHVEVESCQCQGFRYRKSCKHVVIVQNWYNKIYASNIEKAEMKALEISMDASDEQEALYEMAELVEQVSATEDQTTSTVKIAQLAASLNIAIEEVARIATIAADYQQEIKPKHTEMTLPVGPGDTRKRKKIDHHSKVTASFFNGLPSRNPAA